MEGNCLKGWGLKAMMSELTQIFNWFRVGREGNWLKGWGLNAMMSELTQIFIDSDFQVY